MKKAKASDFIAYLEDQVLHHSIFVWGGQGETGSKVTERWIRRRERDQGGKKVNGRYYSYADLAVNNWKRQCELGYGDILSAFDCSGLLVYYLMKVGVLTSDRNANSLKGLCEMTRTPKRGYWLFRISNGRATHIGMMVSDTEVIHAKGRVEGVVKETVGKIGDKCYWNAVGIPNCVEIDDAPAPGLKKYVRPLGNVRVREGNGTEYKLIKPTATAENLLPYLGQDEKHPNWYYVEWSGRNGYITSNPNYTKVVEL